MPIYGYTCTECGHALDALQKMADDPLKDCPECEQPALKRQLSAPRFRLKGKGWYETDFKSDNQRNLAGDGDKADKSEKADKSDKGSEKKSDKSSEKPAAKSKDKAAAKPKKSESAA